MSKIHHALLASLVLVATLSLSADGSFCRSALVKSALSSVHPSLQGPGSTLARTTILSTDLLGLNEVLRDVTGEVPKFVPARLVHVNAFVPREVKQFAADRLFMSLSQFLNPKTRFSFAEGAKGINAFLDEIELGARSAQQWRESLTGQPIVSGLILSAALGGISLGVGQSPEALEAFETPVRFASGLGAVSSLGVTAYGAARVLTGGDPVREWPEFRRRINQDGIDENEFILLSVSRSTGLRTRYADFIYYLSDEGKPRLMLISYAI